MHVEVIGRAPVVVLHVALAGRPSPKSARVELLKIKTKCAISPHRGPKKKHGLTVTPIDNLVPFPCNQSRMTERVEWHIFSIFYTYTFKGLTVWCHYFKFGINIIYKPCVGKDIQMKGMQTMGSITG